MSKNCTNAGCSYTHAHTVEWCGYPEPKNPTNNHKDADSEALLAWLGGYLESTRASLEPMSDDYWQGYLQGTNRLGESVLNWLDRNLKEA